MTSGVSEAFAEVKSLELLAAIVDDPVLATVEQERQIKESESRKQAVTV